MLQVRERRGGEGKIYSREKDASFGHPVFSINRKPFLNNAFHC